MPTLTTLRGIRSGGLLLLAAVAVLLSSCTPEQTEVYEQVNKTRAELGLGQLLPDPALMNKAQAWAEHLAGTDTLAHSDLVDGVPQGWTIIGENVGRGPTIRAIHDAYLNSPDHYANIIDPRFRWIGTGHAVDENGKHYTVHVFASYRTR